MGIRPPSVTESWDDCDVWTQSLVLAYNQIREYEELELLEAQIGKN